MITGRVIFGIGAEFLCVVQVIYINYFIKKKNKNYLSLNYCKKKYFKKKKKV